MEEITTVGIDLAKTIFQIHVVDAAGTPLERSAIVIHLNTQAQMSATPPLALQPGLSQLAPARRGALTRRALALNVIGVNNLAEGVTDGSCRQLDTTLTSQIFAGYFLGLPQTMGAQATDGSIDPIALANFVVDLAAFGLRTRKLGIWQAVSSRDCISSNCANQSRLHPLILGSRSVQ